MNSSKIVLPLTVSIIVAIVFPMTAADTSGGELMIVGPLTEDESNHILSKFTAWYQEKYGMEMKATYFNPGGQADVLRLVKEQAGNPEFDVWLGGPMSAFIKAKEEGLLEPYKYSDWSVVPDSLNGLKLKCPEGYFSAVDVGSYVIMWNNDLMKSLGLTTPETWNDLLDPMYFDEVIVANPVHSGSYHMIVEAVLQMRGWEEGWNYWKALSVNIKIFPDHSSQVPALIELGEFLMAPVPSFYSNMLIMRGANVSVTYPKDGTPLSTTCVAILEGARNIEIAKIFVDWLFSRDGQKVAAESSCLQPVRPDVETLFSVDISKLAISKYNETLVSSRWDEVNDKFTEEIIGEHNSAKDLGKTFCSLNEAILKCEENIDEAEAEGNDVSEAEMFLDAARNLHEFSKSALMQADFSKAEELIYQAKKLVDQANMQIGRAPEFPPLAWGIMGGVAAFIVCAIFFSLITSRKKEKLHVDW